MRPQRKQIGLAVVGCGTIGRIRAEFARDYPGIGWLGLCDSNAEVGAVMGYTNRFRRRFQAVKGKLSRGEIGEVTSVVTRAFMNRMVPIATIRKTNQRQNLTPMVVSGTHALDMSMYLMEGKTPASVYAQSVDKALSMWGTKDSTFGLFTMQ